MCDAPPCPFCGTIAIARGAAFKCPTCGHGFTLVEAMTPEERYAYGVRFRLAIQEEIKPLVFTAGVITRALNVFANLGMRSCDDVVQVRREDVRMARNSGKMVLEVFDALCVRRGIPAPEKPTNPRRHCPTCRCGAE